MSGLGFMVESCIAEGQGKPQMILVDLGYASEIATRLRYGALLGWGLARRNFSIEATPGRLFLRVPPTKLKKLLAEQPIVEGSTYWRATHHWVGLADGELVETPTRGERGEGR